MKRSQTAVQGEQVAVPRLNKPQRSGIGLAERRDEPRTPAKPAPGLGRRLWTRWLMFADIVGTVNMIIILSLIYILFVMLLAVPFKLIADPLRMRRSRPVQWVRKVPMATNLESMRNQY